ncbi:hypothetical protein K8T06_17395, partial [bacterium]|nr:hypothetical protein [bacterium]
MKCPVCNGELIRKEGFDSCEKCGYQVAAEQVASNSGTSKPGNTSSCNATPTLELTDPGIPQDSSEQTDIPSPKPKAENAAKQKQIAKSDETFSETSKKTPDKPSGTSSEKLKERCVSKSQVSQKSKTEQRSEFAKRILEEHKKNALIIGFFGSSASGKTTLVLELLFKYKNDQDYELRPSANEYLWRVNSQQIIMSEAARTVRGVCEICEIDY